MSGFSGPAPADDILAFVRTKLPRDPLKLTGSLKVRTRNGFTKSNLPVTIDLNWGASPATAAYTIDQESLAITWDKGIPHYRFSNDRHHLGRPQLFRPLVARLKARRRREKAQPPQLRR